MAEGYDQVLGYIRGNSQLHGDMRIQAVLNLAHFTGQQIEVVKWQQRDDAAQHFLAAVPQSPVVSVVQAYPAELGMAHRALMKRWEADIVKHAPGFECALEQLATFLALQFIAAVLAAALIQGREQAQNAGVFLRHEARWLVEKVVQ